jgi:hypothetical protein
MLIFVFVKRMAILVTAFLSLFLGGRVGFSVAFSQTDKDTSLSASISDSITDDSPAALGREMSFMSVGGNAFSGNTTGFSGSVRLTQSGRRINPSTKTTFRLVKAGKVVDGRSFLQRGISLSQLLPDLFSSNRQLHLMGILRL